MFLSLASFQAGLQEGSELEEARSCDCQLVFRGQRALGGERESERGCLGVSLHVGPGEHVQGCLGRPRIRVCGCLGVCRSRSLDSWVCLCMCEPAPVNVRASVSERASVRCLCARSYISVEMLGGPCTRLSVCVCITWCLRHPIWVAYLLVYHCVCGQCGWERVCVSACLNSSAYRSTCVRICVCVSVCTGLG